MPDHEIHFQSDKQTAPYVKWQAKECVLDPRIRHLLNRAMISARTCTFALFAMVLVVSLAVGGCTKKFGDAVVLEKEHIAAAEPSPTPSPVTTSSEIAVAAPRPSSEPLQTELAPDEIVVDTYVMKKNVRGTGKDPRASSQEKWLMKAEMIQDRRRFTILADRAHFLKYKVGDKVRVRYKEGNYTGTVWDSQIED
jgi:hypothetical protein